MSGTCVDRKTILVVDDEDSFRLLVEKALSRSGYTIVTAASAAKALEYIVEGKVDLILTDVKMPKGSGFDLMALTQFVVGKIPIVVMSGHVGIDILIDEGIENGAVQCLQKPFTLAELRETVSSVFAAHDLYVVKEPSCA